MPVQQASAGDSGETFFALFAVQLFGVIAGIHKMVFAIFALFAVQLLGVIAVLK
jgi:hypothetical protein